MGIFDTLRDKFSFMRELDDEMYEEEEMNPRLTDEVRSYSYDSPYGSGAAAGAVRRRERTPDLNRVQSVVGGEIRPIASPTGEPHMRIYNARPQTYEDAPEIGDRFKMGTPIVLDLSLASNELKRRYIDFATGLTYGLSGQINKVADNVFMLTPADVELSEAQKRYRKPYFENSI